MRRYVWALLCGAMLAPPVLAAKPAERAGDVDARAQALSGELNQFVEDALREGLLAPAGSGALRARRAPEMVTPEPPPPPAPADSWAPPAEVDCSQPYPLSFSDFRDISHYQDIVPYRTRAETSAGQPGAADNARLARAYIALDLSSEAVMSLGKPADSEGAALFRLASLLDGRRAPDVNYFRALSECHDEAGFWLAVSEVVSGDGAGAQRLDGHLIEFRRLPLQLRARVAAIAIPALDKRGERLLAHKMIAGFSPEEIADSSQLVFSQAVLELSNGNGAAEGTIRNFLLQARFQEEALSALIRNGRSVDGPMKAMLLDGLLLELEQVQRDADVRVSLSFVLEELAADSRYLTMIDMAGRENMQSVAARDEIRRHFVSALQRDLAGDDALRALAAIEALSIETGLLDEHSARAGIYEAGTLKAVRLGFGAMAETLSRKAGVPTGLSADRAALAYRKRDYPSVYQLAETHPEDIQIGLVAALSAIDANQTGQLRSFEARLTLDDATILALIEQDAVSGHWIVSPAVYDAAGRIEDDALKARVGRVLALRRAAAGEMAKASQLTIADVPAKLAQTRKALDALDGETH